MLRGAAITDTIRQVVAGNRAVTAVMIGADFLYSLDNGSSDFHCLIKSLGLNTVGAVMPGTALNHGNRSVRHKTQYVPGLGPNILYPLWHEAW